MDQDAMFAVDQPAEPSRPPHQMTAREAASRQATIFRFTPAVADLLEMVVRARLADKDRRHVASLLIGNGMTEEVATRWGIRSEFAVAELLGVGVGSKVERHAWDGGADLRTRSGHSVQVKFTRHPTGRFALPAYEGHLRADFGVLVTAAPVPDAVVIAGQISRHRFETLAVDVELDRGIQRVVDQSALAPIADLI